MPSWRVYALRRAGSRQKLRKAQNVGRISFLLSSARILLNQSLMKNTSAVVKYWAQFQARFNGPTGNFPGAPVPQHVLVYVDISFMSHCFGTYILHSLSTHLSSHCVYLNILKRRILIRRKKKKKNILI